MTIRIVSVLYVHVLSNPILYWIVFSYENLLVITKIDTRIIYQNPLKYYQYVLKIICILCTNKYSKKID